MKQTQFTITGNTPIARGTYELRLSGDAAGITAPGQFVQLSLPGYFLRRPISVCDWSPASLTLLYKVVGAGTETLSQMQGGMLDVLTGLGNGFDLAPAGSHPLLVGGGAGVAPLYALAKVLRARGKTVDVILGFGSAEEVFYADEFAALGCRVTVTTADGSRGVRGFVTDALDGLDYSFFYACGPTPMLRALCRVAKTTGQLSLEARMACGFGVCMGCSIHTVDRPRRVCADGPVFAKEALTWDD